MESVKQRDGFTFYRSFRDAITELPQDEQLIIFRSITDFALDEIEPDTNDFSGFGRVVWSLIKPNIKADRRRFENGCKGGAPKGKVNNPNGNNQYSREDNRKDNREDNHRFAM